MNGAGQTEASWEWLGNIAEFLTDNNWPLVALIGLYWLRSPISDMIGRIIKAGPRGFEMALNQPTGETRNGEQPGFKIGEDWLDHQKEILETLREQAEKDVANAIKEKGGSDRDWLMKGYVEHQAALAIERTYYSIFGSQLEALRALDNRSGTGKITLLREKYEEARGAYPGSYASFSYETWLHFLTQNSLLTIIDESVTLTDTGRTFIEYVARFKGTGAAKLL